MSEKVRQIISESVLEFQVSRLARGERVAKADIAPLDAYNAGVASQAARIAALELQLAERTRQLSEARRALVELADRHSRNYRLLELWPMDTVEQVAAARAAQQEVGSDSAT